MSRPSLPLELKERIVDAIVWDSPIVERNKERWEEGLKLLLPGYHPLLRGKDHPRGTTAKETLSILCRTTKEFRRICDRVTRELMTGTLTVRRHCECSDSSVESWSDLECGCCDAEEWWTVDWPTQSKKFVKALSLESGAMAGEMWEEEQMPGDCPVRVSSAFKHFSNLRSLALKEELFVWLPALLDALPSAGGQLEQLSIQFPRASGGTGAADRALLALSRCTRLCVLYFQSNHNDGNDGWQLFEILHLVPSIRHIAAWCEMTSNAQRLQQLLNTTSAPLQSVSIVGWGIDDDIMTALLEASSSTLNYIELKDACAFPQKTAEAVPAVTFPQLEHISIDDNNDYGIGAEFHLLPPHWNTPALRHVSVLVHIHGRAGAADLEKRIMEEMGELKYVRIKICRHMEDPGAGDPNSGGESLENVPFDVALWVEEVGDKLRAKGVDAAIIFQRKD